MTDTSRNQTPPDDPDQADVPVKTDDADEQDGALPRPAVYRTGRTGG